jgi:hypothetical protein
LTPSMFDRAVHQSDRLSVHWAVTSGCRQWQVRQREVSSADREGGGPSERTLALVIHGSYPSARWEPDAAWGMREDEWADWVEDVERNWGTEDFTRRNFPSTADDPHLVRWFATYMRRAASPGAAVAAELMERETDVRAVLPTIRVPTLILHRVEDAPEANRYMAEHIPGAKYVAFPGDEHISYLGDQNSVLDEIERFVKGVKAEEASLDRVLATVLFTDVVGSTEKAAKLGDSAWRELLEKHHATVRACWHGIAGPRSTPPATGFSPRSTGQPVRSAALRRSARLSPDLVSRSGRDCIPASAR